MTKKTKTLKKSNKKIEPAKKNKETLVQLKEKYLRLYADFENFRKRTQKTQKELAHLVTQKIFCNILPIQDSITRALTTYANTPEAKGFQAIHEQFKQILTKEGITPIPTQPGDTFNPELHTSTATLPAPKPELKGKITNIIQQGYYLNGKVIRYTQVITGT